MTEIIQLAYAERVRCADGTAIAKSAQRNKLAGPPPGDSLRKATMLSGWPAAMSAISGGSLGSISPLRS